MVLVGSSEKESVGKGCWISTHGASLSDSVESMGPA